MRILLASSNPHKLREIGELAPGVEIVAWQGPPIPEDGAFFQDNALQKAVFARDWACDWCAANGMGDIDGVIADDSGLCIDALFGGPGVLSARFAPRLSYPEKNRLLLGMVAPGESRRCRFVCVMAFAPLSPLHSAGAPFAVSGTVEGTLADEPRGEGGFGYDPIFVPDGYGATFGELGQEVKNRLSHRGKAARKMMEVLLAGGRVSEQMALPCKEEARW
jgi:XTP/dITP diphosphohydrolase